MKEFFIKIKNNRIVKNSLILINGTIISQIINIILSPIMSRLYDPAEFGKYSTITAIVVLTTIIANGKYDLAIMNSEDDEKQRKATYYGAMIISVITTLIILLFGGIIVLHTDILNSYTMIDIVLIAIFTFFASNNSIVNIWLNKTGYYKQISKNRILYAIVHAILVIVFGIIETGYLGIALSVLVAYISQFVYVYSFLYRKTNFKEYHYNVEDVKEQLHKHIKFPKFQMPALLLNNASTQLPVILFNSLYNSTISGWYSMTVKIINLPMTVIGSTIGEIYFKEASEIKAKGEEKRLSEFTYNTFKKLLLIGILPMGVLFAYGDILFEFVLGEQWKMAGVYAMFLAPWYFIVFVTSPFTHLFAILNKQNKNLVLNIIMLLSRVITIVLGYLIFKEQSTYTVFIFAVVGFFIWVATNGYLFKLVNISYKKSIINTICIFFIVCAVCVLTRVIGMQIIGGEVW